MLPWSVIATAGFSGVTSLDPLHQVFDAGRASSKLYAVCWWRVGKFGSHTLSYPTAAGAFRND